MAPGPKKASAVETAGLGGSWADRGQRPARRLRHAAGLAAPNLRACLASSQSYAEGAAVNRMMVVCDTPKVRAMAVNASPASRRAMASRF